MILRICILVSYVLGVLTPGEELAEDLVKELVPELRIIGGNEVSKTDSLEYPFMTSLQHYNIHKCGGTMLSNTMVLTAAHCSETPDGWVVIAGVLNYKTFDGKSDLSTSQSSIVQSVIRHPKYNTQTIENDIAVWFLPGNGIRGFETSTIRISSKNDDQKAEGHLGSIAGWGATDLESKAASDDLNHLSIPIFKPAKCQYLLKGLKNFTFSTVSNICAGDLEGKSDGCQGDSGGPLFIKNTNTNSNPKYIIVGISSFGIECATKGVPAVYTRVSHYQDFINSSSKIFKDTQQDLINKSKEGIKYHSDPSSIKRRPKRPRNKKRKSTLNQYHPKSQTQYQSNYQQKSQTQLQPQYQPPSYYKPHRNQGKRHKKRRKKSHNNSNWGDHNNPWNPAPWPQDYYVGQPAPHLLPPPPSPYDPVITGYAYIDPNIPITPYYPPVYQPFYPGY